MTIFSVVQISIQICYKDSVDYKFLCLHIGIRIDNGQIIHNFYVQLKPIFRLGGKDFKGSVWDRKSIKNYYFKIRGKTAHRNVSCFDLIMLNFYFNKFQKIQLIHFV